MFITQEIPLTPHGAAGRRRGHRAAAARRHDSGGHGAGPHGREAHAAHGLRVLPARRRHEAAGRPRQVGTDFEFPQILKPLEPFNSHMTIVSGLRNKGGESSDPHGIIAGTWLSCYGPARPRSRHERGTTADQLAARHFGQDTPLPSLELSGESIGGSTCAPGTGCGFGSTMAFRTPTQPLPMEDNPRKVFYQLFGQGDTDEERARHRARDRQPAGLRDRKGAAAEQRARRRGPHAARGLPRFGARDRAARAEDAGAPASAPARSCPMRRSACPTTSASTST